MRVIGITCEDYYPFYDWGESGKTEVPQETIDRWTKVMRAFFEAQAEMAGLCGELGWRSELLEEAIRFAPRCSRCGGELTEGDGSGMCCGCVDELAARPWVSVMDPRTREEYRRDHPSGEV